MIRFAIWAAVSSKAQATPDKISLTDQEARCRATALAKGWVETSGPYIVPGESRTLYVDLQTAERAIPQLRDMLDAAKRGQFDILVMYDNNRFRDLLLIVARVLISYRIQPYSLVQPVEPQPPETFDANRADTLWMMLGMSDIISHTQLTDLRRKYAIGMPARVRDKGLPAISIPFGYRKPPGRDTDRNVIPEQDPVTAPIVVAMKDLLLAGRTMEQIQKFLVGTGVKPPRGPTWHRATIREILRNPFYAGYNRWGMSKTFTDLRTGKRIRNRDVPLDTIIVERGKHQPLWDDATQTAILAELDRRGKHYQGKTISQFNKLLKCETCKSSMWMQHNGSRTEPNRSIWRCSKTGCNSAAIHHSAAIQQITDKLREILLQEKDPTTAEKTTLVSDDPITLERRRLDELLRRRERIIDLYETGGLTKPEYLTRRTALDNQIYTAEKTLHDALTAQADRAARQQMLSDFKTLINHLPTWLATSDPQEVNSALSALLKCIYVLGDQVTEIVFK